MKDSTKIFKFSQKLLFYFTLVHQIVYAQSQDTLTLYTETRETGFQNHYLLLGTQKTYVANDNGVIKGRLIKNLSSFPELRHYVKKNLKLVNNYEDFSYLKNIVRCYNDASASSFKIENISNYLHKYNLYSKKEIKKGPTKEMLKTKQFINSKTLFIENTTTHTNNETLISTSTYGSQFKSHFTYGNSPFYSTGFMLRNLKRALNNDKEAVKYIKRYRFKYVSRTALNLVGIALASIVVVSIADNPPFGLTDKSTPFFGAASVFIIGSRYLRPAEYKEKCIKKAVEIYNLHLLNENKLLLKRGV